MAASKDYWRHKSQTCWPRLLTRLGNTLSNLVNSLHEEIFKEYIDAQICEYLMKNITNEEQEWGVGIRRASPYPKQFKIVQIKVVPSIDINVFISKLYHVSFCIYIKGCTPWMGFNFREYVLFILRSNPIFGVLNIWRPLFFHITLGIEKMSHFNESIKIKNKFGTIENLKNLWNPSISFII